MLEGLPGIGCMLLGACCLEPLLRKLKLCEALDCALPAWPGGELRVLSRGGPEKGGSSGCDGGCRVGLL